MLKSLLFGLIMSLVGTAGSLGCEQRERLNAPKAPIIYMAKDIAPPEIWEHILEVALLNNITDHAHVTLTSRLFYQICQGSGFQKRLCRGLLQEQPAPLQQKILDYITLSGRKVSPDWHHALRRLSQLISASTYFNIQLTDFFSESYEQCQHKLATMTARDSCFKFTDAKNLYLLPIDIAFMPHIKCLYLVQNQISFLGPEMRNLRNLTCLDLSRNNLQNFPLMITQLASLKSLYLEHNQIHTLPRQISRLVHLQRLELYDNKITHIPEEIGALGKLNELVLHNNYIHTLPPNLGRLKTLRRLSLHHNLLQSLPPELLYLERLETLDLANNNLCGYSHTPLLLSFPLLTTLILDHNFIQTLSPNCWMPSLTSLSLSHNIFMEVPSVLKEFPALRKLDLSHNIIVTLDLVLNTLPQLQEAALHHNLIALSPAEKSNLHPFLKLGLIPPLLLQHWIESAHTQFAENS